MASEAMIKAAARDLSVALTGISGALFSDNLRDKVALDLAEIALAAAERAAWQPIETVPRGQTVDLLRPAGGNDATTWPAAVVCAKICPNRGIPLGSNGFPCYGDAIKWRPRPTPDAGSER